MQEACCSGKRCQVWLRVGPIDPGDQGARRRTHRHPAVWAGTGLGTSLLTGRPRRQRLESKPIPEAPSGYGLGLEELRQRLISHNGQLIGRESVWLYNTETGAAPDGVMPMTVARYVAGFNATELAGRRAARLPATSASPMRRAGRSRWRSASGSSDAHRPATDPPVDARCGPDDGPW